MGKGRDDIANGWKSRPFVYFVNCLNVVATQHAYHILVRRVIIPQLEYYRGICPYQTAGK